jgi:hypothetical protein
MSEGTADSVRVVVAVDPDRYADVVDALRGAGLAVESQWPVTGTLAGTVREPVLPALRSVDGVVSIELDRTHRIEPPGSAVQ